MSKITTLKSVAIIMLFIALFNNPYGYYQILRWVVCGITAYLAYAYYKENNKTVWIWIFIGIAILFNPIFVIHLDREIWSFLNVVVILILFINIFKFKENQDKTKNCTSKLQTSDKNPNDEIISLYHKMRYSLMIPADEPNYELAKKVFLEFNNFNLKNLENDLIMYLDFIPKSLLPYPKNYIKCAYYIFLDKLKKDKNLKMFNNAQEIGTQLFCHYPDYKKYKENLIGKYTNGNGKKWVDTAVYKDRNSNPRETFKKLYGVYEISEEDYNSSPSSIDSTEETLLYDFGVLPEIEEDVDVGKIMKESKKLKIMKD